MRTVYDGVKDLVKIMPDLTADEIQNTDFGSYRREEFYDDLGRVTQYRTDPNLAEKLIEGSFETLEWMHSCGVRFLPLYGRQSFEHDGKVKFWGGLTVEAWGGGPGLIDSLTEIARNLGVDIHYGVKVTTLLTDEGGRVNGIMAGNKQLKADAVVLACGGFESNPEWRTIYLRTAWELQRIRVTSYNTRDRHTLIHI